MDEDAEITLIGEEESSNPQTDQNSTDAGYTVSTEMASIEITRESHDGDSEKEQEEEMAEIIKNNSKKPKEGAGHMDKFKRRLIRAIANYFRNDQTPPDEIWDELQKQSGCDCKLLWWDFLKDSLNLFFTGHAQLSRDQDRDKKPSWRTDFRWPPHAG